MTSWVSPGDESYPTGLLDLGDPPALNLNGALSAKPHVSIVGTRTCTRYGVEIAAEMARRVASVGWVVVSGLARGIDTAAHSGSLEGGGLGLAILGSGLERVDPRDTRHLASKLIETGGAVVSEYPPEAAPARWTFPRRNRLIAAISVATVVVESAARGGAQITALMAAEMGRPVFAVPGDIDRPASVGTNQLIRDGALPVLGAADLVQELSLLTGMQSRPSPSVYAALIPRTGVEIEELPAIWDCSVKEALVRLGQLEATGDLERVGERVIPLTRS